MSDELTKLAKLANSAAGDYQPNSLTAAMSPQNFGKYHSGGGGPMMGPLKEIDKGGIIGRAKQGIEMVQNYNSLKLECIKEENGASYNSSVNVMNNVNSLGIVDKKEDALKKESGGPKKEENGGVFHENTDQQQLDMKNLPVTEKLRSSPNWGPKQTDGHMGMNNRIDGSQFPHMPVQQYPQHYPTGPNPTPQSHVFSTLIANQAAKAVYTGQANSIITFHQSLTAKRKFLDPEQDIKLDAPMNQPPASTPTPPQTDGNGTAPAANKHDGAETIKSNDNNVATPSNGQKEESNGPASNKSVSNPKTPQPDQPPRPPTAPESAPTTTTKKTGGAKRGKRKRSQSTTQPLHPTMPGVAGGPNMAMQQGMPPSGPSFAPFPRGSFGGGPYPQSPQMRPGMPPGPQGGIGGPSTTETENLDPSALWENPPANKRRQMMSTMAPSWAQQQQEFAMANQSMAPGGGSVMMPPSGGGGMMPEGMMNPRAPGGPFMGRGGPHDQFPMPGAGGSPYDMAGFNPGAPMDNLTPEQMRHREESLRTLKEMQKMLFPEEHGTTASPAPGGMLSPHRPMPPDGSGPPMMHGPNGGMVSPSMMGGPMIGPGHPMMAMRGMSPAEQQRFMMSQPSMAPPLPQDYESMTPQQKAWVKLQQEFYMEKQRKMMEEQAKMQQSHMMDFPGRGPPIRFGPSPFPPGGGDPMVGAMPPPPPYHASASSMLQRRASMSGSFSPGGGGPHGSFGPMSPHAMSATQPPAGRLARSNSLPSAQMPMGPGGAMPMQGSLSPESAQIRPQFRASTPTPGSLTAGASTAGMNPGSVGGPLSAPAMTSNSPGMSMGPQSCDTMVHTPGSMAAVHSPHPNQPGTTGPGNMMQVNSPRPNNHPAAATPGSMVVHSPHPGSQPVGPTPGSMVVNSPRPNQPVPAPAGNMVVHSPHPNQPGTPVMDQGMPQTGGGPAGNIRQSTPNNTPSPAVSIAKQAMVTSGNQRCSPKSTVEHPGPKTTASAMDNTPPSTVGDNSRKSGGPPSSGEINVQQHQKLVNFPTSQLNRDKAPNFPPRGEDLQQYTSTFYGKSKEQPGGGPGPNRMPPQFSSGPVNRSPMNTDLMNAAGNPGNVMSSADGLPQGMINNGPATTIANRMAKVSQQNLMTSQPNLMTSQPSNIMTSQPNMMTSQPNMMVSQQKMMTSQQNVMTPAQQTSQAAMMMPQAANVAMSRGATQPRAIAPAQPTATAPQMTTHPNMLTSAGNRMSSQANMATSQPNVMNPQPNAMASMQQNMMASMNPGMMTPHSRMMSSPSQMAQMSQPNMVQSQMGAGMMGGGNVMSPHGQLPQGMIPGGAGMMNAADRVMMSPRMMTSQVRGPMSSNGPMMSPGMRMGNPMMDAAMMGGPQGRPMMAHPDLVMQQQAAHKGHMMASNMGPPMEGMVAGGPMDPMGGNPRFTKGPMMPDGMMPEGMDHVMEHHQHPMSRQQMMAAAVGGMRQPQSSNPLSLLQTRFSPPLPPDGKGPTKTLQYFPPGSANAQVQGQGGNPHLNPTPNQPSPGPAPGPPKQIQMPFPMEMITSGPSTSPSLSQAMGPHRMAGMAGAGGMGPRMMQADMMYHPHHPHHHHGNEFGPRGPVPVGYMGGPRPGMSPYGPMQHVGPARMPAGMAQMGPMQGGGAYMDPGFGPQMMGGPPMGPGYSMPR